MNQIKKKLEFNENREIDRFIHNYLIYLHQEKYFFYEYNVGLFINCTETKFVTLSNNIYFYFNKKKTYIVFQITPKVVIYFIKENNNAKKKLQLILKLLFIIKNCAQFFICRYKA